ncbi:hypothetical protein [Moorena producens]|nr:hypothetical protein [Moorena producens]
MGLMGVGSRESGVGSRESESPLLLAEGWEGGSKWNVLYQYLKRYNY